MFSFDGGYLPDKKLCFHYHVQDSWICFKSNLKIGSYNFVSSINQFKVLNQFKKEMHSKHLF